MTVVLFSFPAIFNLLLPSCWAVEPLAAPLRTALVKAPLLCDTATTVDGKAHLATTKLHLRHPHHHCRPLYFSRHFQTFASFTLLCSCCDKATKVDAMAHHADPARTRANPREPARTPRADTIPATL